jgi:hypothetical protein
MRTHTRLIPVLLALLLIGTPVGAAAVTFSGYFNDSNNAFLKGYDLGAAQFGDDYSIANNVALYTVTVAVAGTVTFDSLGFAMGGADPYFTLFNPDGTFTSGGSNYDQAFSTGGDFDLSYLLAAGDYTFAIGTFANMSFAENWGTGTLADGFTGLGGPYYLGNSYYEVDVTTPTASVPEPATLLLLGTGLAALAGCARRWGRAGS